MSQTEDIFAIDDEAKLYEMMQPHESMADANDAVRKFLNDVYDLRCKHRLAHVSVIIKDSVKDHGQIMSRGHIGSELEQESMAAWHLGQSQADRQRLVSGSLERGLAEALKRIESRQ